MVHVHISCVLYVVHGKQINKCFCMSQMKRGYFAWFTFVKCHFHSKWLHVRNVCVHGFIRVCVCVCVWWVDGWGCFTSNSFSIVGKFHCLKPSVRYLLLCLWVFGLQIPSWAPEMLLSNNKHPAIHVYCKIMVNICMENNGTRCYCSCTNEHCITMPLHFYKKMMVTDFVALSIASHVVGCKGRF